jgi:hypothetical protein
LIQAIIDLQDKIQREGTIMGKEFRTEQRQQPKRALIELPVIQKPWEVASAHNVLRGR